MKRDDPNERDNGGPLFRRDPKELYRSSDPNTSMAAAVSMVSSGQLGEAQRRALDYVQRYPGRTALELSRLAGDGDPRRINRRLGELRAAGKIHRGESKPDPITGKSGYCWWPTA